MTDLTRPDPGGLVRPGETGDDAPDLVDHPEPSGLDLLRRAVDATVAPKTPTWDVPNRPGFKARYTTAKLTPAKWQSILDDSKRKGVVSVDAAYCLLLAHQCTGLYIDDELVTSDGGALRFGHPTVRHTLGVENASDAVRVFYGGPKKDYGFAIQSHALDLLELAGAGADLGNDTSGDGDDDDEDPTGAAAP